MTTPYKLPAPPPPWRLVGDEYHLDHAGLIARAEEPRPRNWRGTLDGWWGWAWYRHGKRQASTTAGPEDAVEWAMRSHARDLLSAAQEHERQARALRKELRNAPTSMKGETS